MSERVTIELISGIVAVIVTAISVIGARIVAHQSKTNDALDTIRETAANTSLEHGEKIEELRMEINKQFAEMMDAGMRSAHERGYLEGRRSMLVEQNRIDSISHRETRQALRRKGLEPKSEGEGNGDQRT